MRRTNLVLQGNRVANISAGVCLNDRQPATGCYHDGPAKTPCPKTLDACILSLLHTAACCNINVQRLECLAHTPFVPRNGIQSTSHNCTSDMQLHPTLTLTADLLSAQRHANMPFTNP
jgi:hypothetical protein